MHVSSNCHGRPRPRGRPITAVLTAVLAGLAGLAQSAEFDQKLRAPMVRNAAELRPRLDAFITHLQGQADKSPLEAMRDNVAGRERFDLQWHLGRLVDAHQPLQELADLGVEPDNDGAYRMDMQKHPEWRRLDDDLVLYSKPELLEKISGALLERGFRPEDLDAWRRYASEHDLERQQSMRKLSLVLSTSRLAKKFQAAKRPFDDQMMLSFFYQKGFDAAELRRQWASGLLEVLDPQRQRILASFLTELPGVRFIAPTDTRAALEQERQLLLRPDSEQLVRTAFEEGKL